MIEIVIKHIKKLKDNDHSVGKRLTRNYDIISKAREEYLEKVCKLNNDDLYKELLKTQIPSYMGKYSAIDIFRKFIVQFIFEYKLKKINFLK